jgi:hypothetical protein
MLANRLPENRYRGHRLHHMPTKSRYPHYLPQAAHRTSPQCRYLDGQWVLRSREAIVSFQTSSYHFLDVPGEAYFGSSSNRMDSALGYLAAIQLSEHHRHLTSPG